MAHLSTSSVLFSYRLLNVLSKEERHTLIFEYAARNGVEMLEKWQVTKKGEKVFWLGFKTHKNLAIRRPEALPPRATTFHRRNVD